MKYYAQCVAGLQDVAAELLQGSRLAPVDVSLKEEGLVVFESRTLPGEIGKLPFLNNCYLILAESSGVNLDAEALLRQLTSDRSWCALATASIMARERTFRVMLSDTGRLVRAAPQAMGAIVAVIAESTALQHAPRHADAEFWIIRRRSGRVFFCKRITRRERTERNLQPGELRPELVHPLCVLSEPVATDVFLDPFAGSGAIPFARALMPYNMIYLFDSNPQKVAGLKETLKHDRRLGRRKGSPIIAAVADARKLDRFDDGFIDKIVTDPPWGLFDLGIGDVFSFYRSVLSEFCRVTKGGGIIVMVIGQEEVADTMSLEFGSRLETVARYNILVAGKKANVMKWRRE